jgi:hypothetical protein
MNIQKMKAGKDTYYSLDLLDHGEGINGFTNVKTIVQDYSSSIKRVYQSNISFSEKHNEYFFEEFNSTQNPTVILEEDMFGKEKVWLKASGTTEHLISKIEKDSVLNKKLKKEIVESAILSTYKNKNIERDVLSKITPDDHALVAEHINTGKLAHKFVSLVEKTTPTYIVDGGNCFVHIHQKDLNNFKELLEKDLHRVISTKNMLIKKSKATEDTTIPEKAIVQRKNTRKIV